jgi:hypothetical protein
LRPSPRTAKLDRERAPARFGTRGDQLTDERDLGVVDLASSKPQHGLHAAEVNHVPHKNASTKSTIEICEGASRLNGDRNASPLGRRVRPIRVTAGEQHLELVREQLVLHGARSTRPVAEPSLRQSLLAQPESLPIVRQDLDRGRAPIPEHEERARERICTERRAGDKGDRSHIFGSQGSVNAVGRTAPSENRCLEPSTDGQDGAAARAADPHKIDGG